VSKSDPVAFAPAVLRSLPALVPAEMTQADLALELGLSALLQMAGTGVDDALGQLWAVRQAVLEAGGMDEAIEPIPLLGGSDRLGLLHMALYLGNLLQRAAGHLGCDRDTLVGLALARPVLRSVRRTALPDIRQLRSS
jgi:hypothetical protein